MNLSNDYKDYRIYRNIRVAKRLAIVSLFLSMIMLSILLITLIVGGYSESPLLCFPEALFFYLFLSLCPMQLIVYNDDPKTCKPKPMSLNPAHSDIRMILISFFMALLPVFLGCTLLPFISISEVILEIFLFCFLIFFPHIPLYVGCFFLIASIRFIKREPIFINETQEIRSNSSQYKKDFLLAKKMKIKTNQDSKNQEKTWGLLEKCGFRFFLKYHKQIAVFPLSDVDIVETFSLREKQLRYSYAKRIIDEGLTKTAAEIILSKQSLLTPSELQAAQEILDS